MRPKYQKLQTTSKQKRFEFHVIIMWKKSRRQTSGLKLALQQDQLQTGRLSRPKAQEQQRSFCNHDHDNGLDTTSLCGL